MSERRRMFVHSADGPQLRHLSGLLSTVRPKLASLWDQGEGDCTSSGPLKYLIEQPKEKVEFDPETLSSTRKPMLKMSVLLVFFLLVLSAAQTNAPDVKVVSSPNQVVVEKGANATLPCHTEPKWDLTQNFIEWSIELKTDTKTVHVCKSGEDLSEEQDARFKGRTEMHKEDLKKGIFSIKIINVTQEDNGNYTCQVLINVTDYTSNVTLEVRSKVSTDQNIEDSTTTAPTTTSSGEHGPGAKAGIGIGCGVFAVVALALGILYTTCPAFRNRLNRLATGKDSRNNPNQQSAPGDAVQLANQERGPEGSANEAQVPLLQGRQAANEESEPGGSANEERGPGGSANEERGPGGSANEESGPEGSANEESGPGGSANEESGPEGSANEERGPGGSANEESEPVI